MAFPSFEVLNPDYEWDITKTHTGTSAKNGMHLTVGDATTIASGYPSGILVSYNATGTKTGGTVACYACEMTVTGNTTTVEGIDIYMTQSGNDTIDSMQGIAIYIEDPGSGCGALYGMRMQLYNRAAVITGCMSFRNIGSGVMDFVIQLEDAGFATYFIKQDGTGGPFVGGSHTSVHGYYTCYIAGNVCYIPLYT